MKTIAVVALLVAVAYGHTMQLTRVPSRMEQLIAEGRWTEEYRNFVVRSAIAAAGNESQPQTDIYNTFYLGQVDIGTPKQTFTVVMDTGSSDLWVTDSTYQGPIAGKKKFDSSKSSTYKNIGGSWVIHYGSGSAEGFKGSDNVCFTNTNLCSSGQVFGQATKEGVQARQPISGILGLAFQTISSIKTPTPWANIVDHGNPMPDNPWFTFWLEEPSLNPQGTKGGQITFGNFDTQHCSSSVDWVPLSHTLWYEINIDGAGVGGTFTGAGSAISDTGTSFLIGPSTTIQAIAKGLNAQFDGSMGLYSIPCTPGSKTIDIKINGKVYSIRGKNYIVSFDGGNNCYVAMAGAFLGNPEWILGDTFIREYCNSYDIKNKRIGLAKAN